MSVSYTHLDAMSYSYNKNIIHKYWDIIKDTDGCMTNDIGALSCLAVARQMAVSYTHLYRVFQKAFGETPLDYRRRHEA